MCEELSCPNICVFGSFNADKNNAFGQLLDTYCNENEYLFSDRLLLPNDSFTFVSDCHGKTSWLDHCLTSDSVHNCISSIKIC